MSWRSATCSANVNRGLHIYKFNASTRQALWWEQPAALHRGILIYSFIHCRLSSKISKQLIRKTGFFFSPKNGSFLLHLEKRLIKSAYPESPTDRKDERKPRL